MACSHGKVYTWRDKVALHVAQLVLTWRLSGVFILKPFILSVINVHQPVDNMKS